MKKVLLSIYVLLFFFSPTFLSAKDEVLFTVGDTKVNKSEFEYIYQKNNFNNKADFSKKSLQDYLDLYINFRLKVKQAIALGLDTSYDFQSELATYEQQLLDSYLDKEITQKLIKQEYDRSKTDVLLSHIFFRVDNPSEDQAAYKKCLDVYNKIKNGASFAELVSMSDDEKSAKKGGQLGWFNSYQIALPEVEDAAYTLAVGQVSAPIKSKIGYHILRVDKTRPAYPKIKVAIIKRFLPVGDTSQVLLNSIADTIQAAYKALQLKVPFEKVVQKYSQDESSIDNKGILGWMSINKYAKVFEDNAYSLKDGEYSKPFKTGTAWYIVKRLETEKPMKYVDVAQVLKAKLLNLPVYQYETDKFINKLRNQYNVKEFADAEESFKNRLIEISVKIPFTYVDTSNPNTIIQIENKNYTENDLGAIIQDKFYSFYTASGKDKFTGLINKAIETLIINHYKEEIKNNDTEYKALMNEYKNGIMIFSLSERNVWNKASVDSVGLEQFYNSHKSQFDLKNRATVRTINLTNKSSVKQVNKFLQKNPNISDDSLWQHLTQKGAEQSNVINSKVLDETQTTLNVKENSISQKKLGDGTYQIIQVYQTMPAKTPSFEECKGYVVAAYQDFLEKKWIETLKQKYPVNVNQVVFESLVKKP
ncbi:MAG: peptidylprolyl isomerase [Bacteroidetes bacterium]|nr:peptidylprolyl isomerase [Bacteroidota bacterium]